MWQIDAMSRFHPFAKDAEVTTAGALVAHISPEGDRAPVYWCCIGSPHLSCFHPIILPGVIPHSLQLGAGGLASDLGEKEAGERQVLVDRLVGREDACAVWGLCHHLDRCIAKLNPASDDAMALRGHIRRELATCQTELVGKAYKIAFDVQVFLDSGDNPAAKEASTRFHVECSQILVDTLTDLVEHCEYITEGSPYSSKYR